MQKITMNLRNGQRILDAEIVIYAAIKLDKDGNVENKDVLQKCPHCHTGGGSIFHRAPFKEDGQSEIGFVCDRCSKRWHLRYKNPFLIIQI